VQKQAPASLCLNKRVIKATGFLERTLYCLRKEGKAGASAAFTSSRAELGNA
jgi:hypothetical protein